MAISNLLATINAVSFFSGKPDHFLARPLSQTTPRIQTSCCHREPSFKPWTPIMMSEVETYTKSDSHGVGIFRFLQGKSYLITGATGFLAKVLILKLVRESPEIGNIFILMKTQDQESANKRLYDEIISSDLFRLIKQTHGSSYEAFMKSKLIPVVGDIGEDNLGIKSRMAYRRTSEAVRKFYGREEIKKLKELGMERAQYYGWENTYTFTKAMGESVIQNQRGDLPVVIIRPSIIESSYKEPFPGWLQGIRMSAPLILAYGKDHIADMWGDYKSSCDIIPVDMVANATIAAMAKHGCGVSETKAYNVTSSSHANPLRLGELMDFSHQHLCDSPLIKTVMELERVKFYNSLEDFTSSVSIRIAKQEGEMSSGRGESPTMLSMKGKRKLKYLVSLARTYQPYTFFQARFDDTNTRGLIQELSMEERRMFGFNGRDIDWEHYIVNVHLPGLKRELFRGKFS
ncbi:hypothetical protein DY000_02056410 [Brassica cretica]|uniref:Fatty acyl-CoA reductase n=2 Tax=Brassica cretica TaxID=69181 RepID=A0ABQ7ABH1_BRACR|nr:hypothetical protein DY000_02056410 [Brassica cretica]